MNSEHNPTLDTADAAARQAAQLARFVRGILVRHGLLGGEFGFRLDDIEAPPPSTRSEAAAPIALRLRPIALDLATLLRLRDIRKSAILAPARLDRDLGGTTPLAVLADLQTALRHCTSLIVFNTAHIRRLAALGAPRITVVDLPAPEPSDNGVIEAQMLAALA